jgi:hypothetical protein
MPILHADLETDLRLAAQLDQALLVTLTDMATIRNVPGAVDFHGSVNGAGSDTSRLRFVGLGGSDHFASETEGAEVSETVIADASVDIAVTRSALLRNISDLSTVTGFSADVNPMALAADMVASYDGYFNSLVTAAGATASASVGTSGADMTHDDFMDGVFTLELASVPGPFYGILHPRQVADWQESLRSEGGATQFMAATADMLAIKGQGYAGSHSGVDIWKMSDVAESGGNKQGFLFGAGTFGYKVAIIDERAMLGAGSSIAVRMDEILVEITRDASKGITEIIGQAYCGVSLKEQARIVGVVTDA